MADAKPSAIASVPQHVLRLHDPDPVLFSGGCLSRGVQDQRGSMRPPHGPHRSQLTRVQHHGPGENVTYIETKRPRGTSSSW